MLVVSFTGPQGPQLQKTLLRMTGQHTVPNIFIGKKHYAYFDDVTNIQVEVKVRNYYVFVLTLKDGVNIVHP